MKLFWFVLGILSYVHAYIESKLVPNTTIYHQKIGFDKNVTSIYRNLRSRRFLACGDGVLDAGEACDDFNTVGGDG